jgi:hypothetical protein
VTKGKDEQAIELLATFFPALLESIEDEPLRQQHPPVEFPALTMEEVENKVFEAGSWKALGDDGLLAVVWKQIWPVVKERVLLLFQTSLTEGKLPSQ